MTKHVIYQGWYRPHTPVNWDGMVPTGKITKDGEVVMEKEASMTKQEFKDECDINNIIKAFQTTGIVNHINTRSQQGDYIDLPNPMDYQEAINIALQAQASFENLPSSVRARFANDPEQFLAFMADPRNGEEMVKLGLATRAEEPSPPPKPQQPPENDRTAQSPGAGQSPANAQKPA